MLTHILLILAAACSAVIAALHVYVIFKGPVAYRRFGAGEVITTMAARGSWFPAVLTWGITAAFAVFSWYYAAAAGLLSAPPMLRTGLIVIGLIYTLRGVMLVPAALFGQPLTAFHYRSSVVSLLIGVLHIAGTSLWLTHDCLIRASGICAWWPLLDTGSRL